MVLVCFAFWGIIKPQTEKLPVFEWHTIEIPKPTGSTPQWLSFVCHEGTKPPKRSFYLES
jgi:hypothetical protein